MPELPEVEHAAFLLRRALVGRTFLQVRVLHKALSRSLPPAACRALRGRRVERVTRRAKHQLIALDDGRTLEVHFMMTGDWFIGRVDDAPPPLERVRLVCDDGTRVSLVDGRAFAVMHLHEAGQLRLPPLGPEPTDKEFDGAYLRAALQNRKAGIKQVLLDQRVVAGLGNIYAAEALWEARISCTVPAATLSMKRCNRLADAIRRVIMRAPGERYFGREGATVLADMSNDWRVYDREGEPCPRCQSRIKRLAQGGRSTYHCPKCQRW